MRFPDPTASVPRRWRPLLAGLLLPLAGCSAFGDGGSGGAGTTLGNLMRYGTATEPPILTPPPDEVADCPSVLVIEGRAAVKQGSSQISISNVARECTARQGGAIAVKVGVEGRALLGAGGGANRFDVPLVVVLRRGDQVLASRTRRVSVAIAPGEAQGSFVAVEADLIVPAGTGEFDIEVGLGGAAPAARVTARTRKRS